MTIMTEMPDLSAMGGYGYVGLRNCHLRYNSDMSRFMLTYPQMGGYVGIYPDMSGFRLPCPAKEGIMEHLPNHHQIRQFMQLQIGWDEISENYQYRIITDIRNRCAESDEYWHNWGEFAANYVEWVKRNITCTTSEPAAIWEQWGELLQELYFGT